MVITRVGDTSFRIQSGSFSILVNSESGRAKADVMLQTSAPLEAVHESMEGGAIIGGGEYEIQGVRVTGYNTPGGKNDMRFHSSYVIEVEQMRVGILDGVDLPVESDVVEKLTELDILIILTPTERVIRRLQPKIAILSGGASSKELEKEMGQKAEQMEKLTIKYKELPATGPKLVTLQ